MSTSEGIIYGIILALILSCIGGGLHVKRKTVIEDVKTRKKTKGETVEELDPSTCLYFFQQVKLAM